MTDGEKLDALARRRTAERESAAADRQWERVAAAARAEADRARVGELARWCEETFAGYVLAVSKMPRSYPDNVHVYFGDARLPPGSDCVGLSFEHAGPETHGERRTILLVLVRAAVGGYEVVTEDGSRTLPTAADARDHLIQFVAEFGAGRARALFEKLGRGKFWGKP